MKYLAFMESNYADVERLTVLYKEVLDEIAKGSDRFPKEILFESHTLRAELYKKSKDRQSFFILETDNPDHLSNYAMQFAPYADVKFIPITDTRKTAEAWLSWKK